MAIAQEKEDKSATAAATDDDAKKSPSGLKSYMRVFSYADNTSRVLYVVAIVAAIAAGVTLPLTNIVFGNFVTSFNNFSIGTLTPEDYMQQVEKLAMYFVYLFIAKFALLYVGTICVSLAAIRTTKALRLHFLRSLLYQDIAFSDSEAAGSTSIKATTNGNLVTNGISDKLTLTIASVSTFFSAFVVALAIQWKLTLITIGIVPVVMTVTGACITLDIPMEAKVMSWYSQAGTIAEEVFSTITTVHAFWLQPTMVQRYDKMLAEAQREGLKKSINYGVMFSSLFFCIYSGYALAFWQGIRMYVSGEIAQSGQIVTVVFALILAATSLQTIALQTMTVANAASAASELFAIIDRKSAIDPANDAGNTPASCNGTLELKDITFEYPSRPESRVLNGFTLSIPAKKTTALVGASGSGKSTIVGLIDRWYDQSAGSITIDGVDIRELNVKWLRSKVRLVQQEPVLFSGSVLDNVAHGLLGTKHESASAETKAQLVEEACKAAFAHDFVARLPQGYSTQIGERARMLSGGQRQRIAIARSIISDPPVLLLDEPTSALDPKAESIVQRALDNVSEQRTTLIIAHKLSTVQRADNIAVMSKGTIIEQGTHQELLRRNGAYAKLVRAQSLAESAEAASSPEKQEDPRDADADRVIDDGAGEELSHVKTDQSKEERSCEDDAEIEAQETVSYSLLKCIYILIGEQRHIWPYYSALAVCSLCAGGTWPALAILFSRTFGVFQLEGSAARKEGSFWSLMFFIVAIANLAIYFSIGVLCNNIAQRVTRMYRLETFKNTISQDLAFFDQENNATGAITSRLSTCATDLNELLGFNCGIILNNIVTVISCSVLGIAYGWKLGLVCALGALPPMLISAYYRVRLEDKLDNDTVKRFASSAALAAEAVAAMRTVASLTLEETIERQYQEKLSDVASKSRKSLYSTMLLYSFTSSVNYLAMALGFWYGGKLVSSGEYDTQTFFVVFIAIVLGGENAAQIFSYSSGIMKAGKAANYIFWLRNRLSSILTDQNDCKSDAERDHKGPASVTCEAVKFAYPMRPHTQVMKGINVDVPACKFVAFVGPSGCGKSTLISLLVRFYDPTSGLIKVDGQPILDIEPRQHRRRIALVQQEPVLYSGSIRDNVAMGIAESTVPSEEQIEEALRSANMLDFVRSLSEGLDTPLGSRGTQLSGGQKQRVAIARALIRDPDLLLLDEATSALDTESEKVVQAALMGAAKNSQRSTVAVAHRLSTIKDADAICVFQAGRIVEVGTHATLLAQRGIYFEMCEGQALDAAV